MTTAKAPTGKQLARINLLEDRVRVFWAAADQLRAEAERLEDEGFETRDLARLIFEADSRDVVLEYLQMLRISRGVRAFSDWWFYRVHLLQGISHISEQRDSTDVERYRELLAVEAAMSSADGELIGILNRAHRLDEQGDDFREFGMTKEEIATRAEALITQLLESGLRP
jgi:hypothetical protein